MICVRIVRKDRDPDNLDPAQFHNYCPKLKAHNALRYKSNSSFGPAYGPPSSTRGAHSFPKSGQILSYIYNITNTTDPAPLSLTLNSYSIHTFCSTCLWSSLRQSQIDQKPYLPVLLRRATVLILRAIFSLLDLNWKEVKGLDQFLLTAFPRRI